MGFLLSAAWVQGEARALHVHVSPAVVRKQFERVRHTQFPRRGEFQRFLRQTKQTVADLLMRVELNMLSARIQRRVASGHRGARAKQEALRRFIAHFRGKWTSQTYCAPSYAVPDCGHVQTNL
jgi:ADP-heptose:LPS heptosyltransferase